MSTGDLFQSAAPQVSTVTELTRRVRGALEKGIGNVWVEGEISNYRRQSSGHQYFVLKDEKCQVSCVLFYQGAQRLRQVTLAEGMQVQVRGDLTVYEARGQYQIIVQVIQSAGAGLLQAKFEALKRKLDAEGLFDEDRKKALPRFPTTVGIVTSPTGAAIRDMLNILHRRAPWIRIIINPARVQGDGAAREIAKAVAEFNSDSSLKVDLIVVARGGGSAEDLSQFNEEILARAIFDSVLPVVSAVGHEIDFTIADFVADLRAPTPSAAAELIAPDKVALLRHLDACETAITRCIMGAMEQWKSRLAFAARGTLFREPANLVAGAWQSVDLAEKAMRLAVESRLAGCGESVAYFLGKLREYRPDQQLEIKRHALSTLASRMEQQVGARMQSAAHSVKNLRGLLRVLAPEFTLKRGFSITTNGAGVLIRSAKQAPKGEIIHTRLADGELRSAVE